MHRPRAELFALLLAACAGSATAPARRLGAVPDEALRTGWAVTRIESATRALLAALTDDGYGTVRRRRIRDEEVRVFLDERGAARAAASVVGMRPRPTDRRWSALRRLRGESLAGWCARGVRVQEPGGAEGFAQRVLTVDRLLVVTDGADGRTGFWVDGLALDDDGWRWLPWVPWSESVEAPRPAHTDIALWVCDLERPPGATRSAPPAR